MDQVDPNLTRRKGLWATMAIAALSGASALAIALPAASNADPEPPPSPPSPTAAPPPGAPVDPNAPPQGPVDPNAPPPGPVEPNAGRIDNAVGGFSFVLPPGWVESDASHLDYGSALLSKTTGQPPMAGQPPPVANDTRIVLGRLDQKLYASAEATNPKAAARLGSDMGEFFMPYAGTRINQEAVQLNANGVAGSASYYEVKFADSTKPNGQIWTGVIGSPAANTPNVGPPQRWFVVWLGTANDAVDKNAAKALAESIRPLGAPPAAPAPGAPPPAAPAPGAPPPAAPPPPGAPPPAAPPPPGAPAPAAPPPGAPAPAAPPPGGPAPAAPPPGGAPAPEAPPPAPGAPAAPPPPPGSAPAGEVAPSPTPAPRTQPA